MKQGWLPDDIQKGKEHFNVFRLDSYVGEYAEPVPYTRRDFYKITFFRGIAQIHYADRSFEVKKQALVFSNPQIPYKWEGLEEVESGYFCIFDQDFPLINPTVKAKGDRPYLLFYKGDISLLHHLNNNVAVIGHTSPSENIQKRE